MNDGHSGAEFILDLGQYGMHGERVGDDDRNELGAAGRTLGVRGISGDLWFGRAIPRPQVMAVGAPVARPTRANQAETK